MLQTILFNTVNEMENKNLAVVLTEKREPLNKTMAKKMYKHVAKYTEGR